MSKIKWRVANARWMNWAFPWDTHPQEAEDSTDQGNILFINLLLQQSEWLIFVIHFVGSTVGGKYQQRRKENKKLRSG